jgi:hypothetical protein
MRTTVALLASLTITAACGGAGPANPILGATSPTISPDTITLAVGGSVTFTVGPNDPVSEITNAIEFEVHYRPVLVTSANGATAELRLIGDVAPETKIWKPGTFWYCCGPPVTTLWVPRSGVVVEVQNPPGSATQTLTLVGSRVG